MAEVVNQGVLVQVQSENSGGGILSRNPLALHDAGECLQDYIGYCRFKSGPHTWNVLQFIVAGVFHRLEKRKMTEEHEKELTADTLKSWGHVPGKEFGAALRDGVAALDDGKTLTEVRDMLESYKPPPAIPLVPGGEKTFHVNIEADSHDETENIASVKQHMTELMRTPTIEAGAIMPDACPAGPLGTIPVGGVASRSKCDTSRNALSGHLLFRNDFQPGQGQPEGSS